MMKKNKVIPYDATLGIRLKWEQEFCIEVEKDDNAVIIRANEAGLISLANHMLTLAQKEVPKGEHIHLDDFNSLEDGSYGLVIEKK